MANRIQVNINPNINTLLEDAIFNGLEKFAQMIENDAKANCPTGNGELRASITHIIERENNKIVAKIGSNLYYAPYVHQGTGIYAINGDGRKEVPWVYKDLQGKWHSTEGMKPNPFLQDAINTNMGNATSCFNTLNGGRY